MDQANSTLEQTRLSLLWHLQWQYSVFGYLELHGDTCIWVDIRVFAQKIINRKFNT